MMSLVHTAAWGQNGSPAHGRVFAFFDFEQRDEKSSERHCLYLMIMVIISFLSMGPAMPLRFGFSLKAVF